MDIASWITLVRCGEHAKDKTNIAIETIFSKILMVLRLGIIDPHDNLIVNKLLQNTTVEINDSRFCLIDIESLNIVSLTFEQWLWKYLRLRKGDCFVDIGAHIGKYTIQVAKIIGDKGLVLSIEAHPYNYKVLAKNILINHLTNIKTFNLAAWNKSCNLKIFTGKSSGRHSVKKNLQILLGNACSKRTYNLIPAKPVDDIIGTLKVTPNYIKIDAGGGI